MFFFFLSCIIALTKPSLRLLYMHQKTFDTFEMLDCKKALRKSGEINRKTDFMGLYPNTIANLVKYSRKVQYMCNTLFVMTKIFILFFGYMTFTGLSSGFAQLLPPNGFERTHLESSTVAFSCTVIEL